MLKQVRWTLLFVAAVALPSGAAAADSLEAARITDPATLASLGFAPATRVYTAAGGDEAPPQNYGGADPVTVTYLGTQFRGRASSYSYFGNGMGDASYLTGDNFTDAQLHLPAGALLESARFWVADGHISQDMDLFLFQVCQPVAGPGDPVVTVLGSGTSSGDMGNQSIAILAPANTVIDNNACGYFLRVRFGIQGHAIQKARVQYRLQVSPAPATATFPGDVPTSHPFFRFVEAMARSGLTGGCGAGLFCPDAPVTRGQLSVFLSVALGLHFPD